MNCLYLFLAQLISMYKRVILLLLVTLLAKTSFDQIKESDLSVIHFLNGDTLQVNVVDQNKWITTVLKPKKMNLSTNINHTITIKYYP